MCRIRWFSASVLGAMIFAAGLGVGVLGPIHQVHADLLDVRVDFGNASNETPANWNLVTAANTPYGLKDFNNFTGPNVASLTYSGFGTSGQNQKASAWLTTWSNGEAPWVDAEGKKALYDYIVAYQSYNPGIATVSGLDPLGRYNIEILSARTTTTSSQFRVNGLAGEAVFPVGSLHASGTLVWNANTDGVENQGIMRWSNVAPNGSGEIVIDVDGAGLNNYAFLMGMRISQVPEPGSVAILAMVLFMACAMRPGRR